ncbi:type III-A CRISPR-associated RAMP protein Csm5 [Facklamia hominis]
MTRNMAQFEAQLLAVSPVHIGSGLQLSKKEYMIEKEAVYFPDLGKLYAYILANYPSLVTEFEAVAMGKSQLSLKRFLDKHRIDERDFGGYRISMNKEERITSDVHQFIRNAYQKPYIPGSSLKGALRTVISYQKGWFDDSNNEFFAGIRVSDSAPILNDQLILCKKYQLASHSSKSPKSLNVIRECLKPTTKVRFTITAEGPEQIETLSEMDDLCKKHYQSYYDFFLKDLDPAYIQNIVKGPAPFIYLGGGAGFWTKVLLEYGDPSRHQRGKKGMVDKGLYKLTKAPGEKLKSIPLIKNQAGFYEMGKCILGVKRKED